MATAVIQAAWDALIPRAQLPVPERDANFSIDVLQLARLVCDWTPEPEHINLAGHLRDWLNDEGMPSLVRSNHLSYGLLAIHHLVDFCGALPPSCTAYQGAYVGRVVVITYTPSVLVCRYEVQGGGPTLAIKAYKSQGLQKAGRREALTLRWLAHENIISFLGLYVMPEPNANPPALLACMATPFASHGDLIAFLRSNPHHSRKSLLAGLIQAVEYLAGINILHGDLKPMNVLVDDNLRAVLIDFNNSVVVQPHHRDRQLASTVLGTATYWAPELTRPGAVQTVESEIWAIGCVVIEVYTAIAPWKRYGNEGISKITAALMEGETPVLETEATHPEVWDLLKECWAKEPANRPSLQGMMGRLP